MSILHVIISDMDPRIKVLTIIVLTSHRRLRVPDAKDWLPTCINFSATTTRSNVIEFGTLAVTMMCTDNHQGRRAPGPKETLETLNHAALEHESMSE
jgi:hypothetical protein